MSTESISCSTLFLMMASGVLVYVLTRTVVRMRRLGADHAVSPESSKQKQFAYLPVKTGDMPMSWWQQELKRLLSEAICLHEQKITVIVQSAVEEALLKKAQSSKGET